MHARASLSTRSTSTMVPRGVLYSHGRRSQRWSSHTASRGTAAYALFDISSFRVSVSDCAEGAALPKERLRRWRRSILFCVLISALSMTVHISVCNVWYSDLFCDVITQGIGFNVNSNRAQCDCIGMSYFFDAVFNDSKGCPVTVRNAISVHTFGV
jgi:hypothetical protein